MTFQHLERQLSLLGPGRRQEPVPAGYHRAGVLVPVILEGDEPLLLFTQRTQSVETHKGQISFPGGTADERDRDIVETALREFEEELGVARAVVRVAGSLDDIATPTGFVITPVVGVLDAFPSLAPNAEEVAEAFTLPVRFFADTRNARVEQQEFRGALHDVWFYESAPHMIWGATARIVRLLLAALELV